MQGRKWPLTFCLIAAAGIGSISALPACARPNPQEGDVLSGTCAACHGNNGISVASSIPNLAGQHYSYLLGQLKAFKKGSRKSLVMNGMARSLTKKEMQDLASYYASISTKVGPRKPARHPASHNVKVSSKNR